MNVRAEIYLTSVAVFINDTPHLIFRRSSFLALQTWPDEACYSLEITFAEGPSLVAKYERKETWAAVLAELAKLDITAAGSN